MNSSPNSPGTTEKLYLLTSVVIILGYLCYFLLR